MPIISYQVVLKLVLLLAVVVSGSRAVIAKTLSHEPKSQAEWADTINRGTVRILTQGLDCACTTMASDMAKVLNDPGRLRLMPVLGDDPLQGIADLIYLSGIDLSILQADALGFDRLNEIHPDIDNKIRYVTKLYNSEIHLVWLKRKGIGLESIEHLSSHMAIRSTIDWTARFSRPRILLVRMVALPATKTANICRNVGKRKSRM